ncbi:hypothetical protein QLQ15_02430 [Lysobacter sp. LF1]|uniref:DUF4440 domain-containing protein n=1 Tax=Lysobacter stagni TaxID=3045172 RepID=A0ABT6XCH3_9GAMM|nr:hypothetical protein [Lysobacter sp. LF1]MDI9237766.1 hypothetical protein [Lysobacter sp. LF1]
MSAFDPKRSWIMGLRMKQLAIAVVLLVALCSCVLTAGASFVPVEQAAIRGDNKILRDSIDRLEPLMAAHGYRMKGTPFESSDGAFTGFWYDGPTDSVATFTVQDGCISFVASVKEGTQDFRAPKSVFEGVIEQLRRDGAWKIQRDEICVKKA